MKQDFTEVMSKRTNEELIEIVSVKRNDYQPEAVEAAEKELDARQVNSEQIEQINQDLIGKETRKKEFNSSKVTSWIRLIHFIIDLIVFFLIAMILSIIFDLFLPISDQEIITLIGYGLFLLTFSSILFSWNINTKRLSVNF